MDRLAGKVALITGAAQGIGEAIAQRFAREGAIVVVADVQDERGESVASSLRAGGAPASYEHLDVADERQWHDLMARVRSRHGRLDVLVNNAGIGSEASVVDEDVETWQRVVDINQKGTWLGMKAAVPAMRDGGGGSIVNVCSVLGIGGDIDHFSYQATKGAIRMMTKNAALTYVGDGIRCNTVAPGMIATDMAEEEDDATTQEWLQLVPMRRHGSPAEIASAALFLASDEAGYITGTDLVVDGGYLAR